MANVKISALPAATTPLTGSEEVAIVQSGDTVRTTIDDVNSAVTLQQVLDNNHDLTDGNNFQGTLAGDSNSGTNVIALGTQAAQNNTGIEINAMGTGAGKDNAGTNVNALGALAACGNLATGDNVNAFGNNACCDNEGINVNGLGIQAAKENTGNNVNAFGNNAGLSNTFNCVNLFGPNATADADSQAVFVANGDFDKARISYANITADRKYELPDASGTLVLSVNSIAPDSAGNVTVPSLPYKVYTAVISQSGTNAPTVDYVLSNNLGFTPNFNYVAPGQYTVTSSFEWITNKTIIFMNNGYMPTGVCLGWERNSSSTITLTSKNSTTGVDANNLLFASVIEIRIYN